MSTAETGAAKGADASFANMRYCFAVSQRLPAQSCTVSLDRGTADALATLLPLLGCGEEAAILGFEGLAKQNDLAADLRATLMAVAMDERAHDALLRGLMVALPGQVPDVIPRQATRRFHRKLQASDVARHFARIAGLDAAVCTILSRLLRPSAPLASDPVVVALLARIRRDEARHVAISRAAAMSMIDQRMASDAAAEAREGLAGLLDLGGAALDQLKVDPDRLCSDVRSVPAGLFR